MTNFSSGLSVIDNSVYKVTIIVIRIKVFLFDKICTVKPVCNDHLYNKIYYLWLIQ